MIKKYLFALIILVDVSAMENNGEENLLDKANMILKKNEERLKELASRQEKSKKMIEEFVKRRKSGQ